MNGEKIQWLTMDGGVMAITEPLTEQEIANLRGAAWYRPLVKYEHTLPDTKPPITMTEIQDTRHWQGVMKRIGTMDEEL